MRTVLTIGAALLALSVATPSQAASSAGTVGAPQDNITLVEGGCGPGGFRAANGFCYRRRPPPPYYRRACPPRFHLTPYGCRRNY